MSINVSALEKKIGINFKNKNILIKSLTHKSFNSVNNNEKLEFLGDRVIGLVLSEKLFEESETILRQFLIFFYKRNTPPDEILINFDLKNTELIKEVISPNKSLEIKKPKKGKKENFPKYSNKMKFLNQKQGFLGFFKGFLKGF